MARYERDFCVFDLGAGNGHLGHLIAERFPGATVVLVDKDAPCSIVPQLQPEGVLWMKREMDAGDLNQFTFGDQFEHFELSLALNILHHIGRDWEKVLNRLLAISEWVLVQTPRAGDDGVKSEREDVAKDIARYMYQMYPEFICLGETVQFDQHLPRPLWLLRGKGKQQKAIINWSFCKKTAWFAHKRQERPWVPGINLWNFLQYGGLWPTRCRLAKAVAAFPLPATPHGDIMPWNFVLRGNGRLQLIDGGESWATWDDAENLAKTVRLVKGESVEAVLGMKP